jgi:hypothetical protein
MRSIEQRPLTFIALLFACMTTACNNSDNSKADTAALPPGDKLLVFDKLVGTWQSEDGKSFERWAKNNDGSFRSAAFSVNGADTSWNEQARIYPENGNWVFENTVKGQNDGKAVKFTSSSITDNSVQFTNPAHDFPTDINYTIPSDSIVNAFIIGPNDKGGKDTIPFNFTRLK